MDVYSVHLSGRLPFSSPSFRGKDHINFLRGRIRIMVILALIQNFSKSIVCFIQTFKKILNAVILVMQYNFEAYSQYLGLDFFKIWV